MDNENINNSREQTEGILQNSETGTEDTPKIYTIEGIRLQIDENGNICVNAEDTARGLGITRIANSGNETVQWSRFSQYLEDVECARNVSTDTYIEVKYIERLRWKLNTEKARQFNAFLLETVISQLKSVAQATCSEADTPIQNRVQGEKSAELSRGDGSGFELTSTDIQIENADSMFTVDSVGETFVTIKNNIALTDSLKVAKYFGSRHSHVLASIRNLFRIAGFEPSSRLIFDVNNDYQSISDWFFPSTYIDSNGKVQPLYLMTKNGFSLLVMGFTGRKAYEFKVQFINEFDRMQKVLLSGNYPQRIPSYMISNSLIRAKRWIAEEEERYALKAENQQLVEQIMEKDETIEELKPSAEFAEMLIGIDQRVYSLGETAKILAFMFPLQEELWGELLNLGFSFEKYKGKLTGRNMVIAVCRKLNIFDSNNYPFQKFVTSDYFRAKYAEKDNEITAVITSWQVTVKGIRYLFKRLSDVGFVPIKKSKGKYFNDSEIKDIISEVLGSDDTASIE